jgi:hypothetical protein
MFSRKPCTDRSHEFEARFDEKLPETSSNRTLSGSAAAFASIKNKVYVCDICIRCGKKVDR